jgi:hypothetical protein
MSVTELWWGGPIEEVKLTCQKLSPPPAFAAICSKSLVLEQVVAMQ